MVRRTFRTALVLAAVAACECGEDDLKGLDRITVTITSPRSETSVGSTAPVSFRAKAANPGGLASFTLKVGSRELKACPPPDDDTSIECMADFTVADYADQVVNDVLRLTALAVSAKGEEASKFVVIFVKARPISVAFVQPAPPPDGSPVRLRGTSNVEVAIDSEEAVELVEVVFDADRPLLRFPAAGPYTAPVDWARSLGSGEHALVARARDASGGTAQAELRVVVACAADADCAQGTRCCLEKGTCHAIVATGADCDCEHPCPESQGCFPGTCGQVPRKCRPGCFPGNDTQRADRCALQDGRTAYCSELPPVEQTAQNRGGACAPADVCDIIQQNCPNLPLDRSRPASPDNPAVPHNCVPVSPVANACIPAGAIPIGGTGCADECGLDGARTNCVKGGLCVTPVDMNYNPTGPARCSKQCLRGSFNGCPGGQICGGLIGRGREPYPTGACSSL